MTLKQLKKLVVAKELSDQKTIERESFIWSINQYSWAVKNIPNFLQKYQMLGILRIDPVSPRRRPDGSPDQSDRRDFAQWAVGPSKTGFLRSFFGRKVVAPSTLNVPLGERIGLFS